MADHNLRGKMVVTYNWAQYVIAAFGDKEPGGEGATVGFDGRFRTCYPQEIVDMHFDFVLGDGTSTKRYRSPCSPPCDGGRVLEHGRPDLVLLCRAQPHSEKEMGQHRDRWVLLYQDKVAQLWGRASRYDVPGNPDYIPAADRAISDAPQVGSVTWPALPARSRWRTKLAGTVDR
jgi:hypothetical protein